MYDQPMTRSHPGCLLFLIDQSWSMAAGADEPSGISNADRVADAVNRLLSGLLARCRDGRSPDQVSDFVHVGAIGYGGPDANGLGEDQFGDGRRCLRPISRLPRGEPGVIVAGPADGGGRLVKRRPWPLRKWIDGRALYGTNMCAALRRATELCQEFVADHPESYPPIVINLTDGAATDGNPRGPAADLTGIHSRQGSALLFNLHIEAEGGPPVEFPAEPPDGDGFARKLFEISSPMPAQMHEAAARAGRPLVAGARGFAYNTPATSLARLLHIGLPASLLPARRRT